MKQTSFLLSLISSAFLVEAAPSSAAVTRIFRPDAPFFARVRVAPQPGTLTKLTARHPHPQGFVEVDLEFRNGAATGVVKTPVPGTFVFGGKEQPLAAGENRIVSAR